MVLSRQQQNLILFLLNPKRTVKTSALLLSLTFICICNFALFKSFEPQLILEAKGPKFAQSVLYSKIGNQLRINESLMNRYLGETTHTTLAFPIDNDPPEYFRFDPIEVPAQNANDLEAVEVTIHRAYLRFHYSGPKLEIPLQAITAQNEITPIHRAPFLRYQISCGATDPQLKISIPSNWHQLRSGSLTRAIMIQILLSSALFSAALLVVFVMNKVEVTPLSKKNTHA